MGHKSTSCSFQSWVFTDTWSTEQEVELNAVCPIIPDNTGEKLRLQNYASQGHSLIVEEK